MCYGSAEMMSPYYESAVKARKKHCCTECGGPIRAGDTYRKCAGVLDGHWSNYRVCPSCWELMKDMSDCGCVFFDTLRELLDNGHFDEWRLSPAALGHAHGMVYGNSLAFDDYNQARLFEHRQRTAAGAAQ